MAITNPYKSGVVGSVSGNTFTSSSGDSFLAADVGRLITITSGGGCRSRTYDTFRNPIFNLLIK